MPPTTLSTSQGLYQFHTSANTVNITANFSAARASMQRLAVQVNLIGLQALRNGQTNYCID